MLRWRCKLCFSTVKPQLYCFGLFLLFTEYFKTTYLTLVSELIFSFYAMCIKAFKFHLALCKLTLTFCVLQETAVRLLIFLFKFFYSFFISIVLEYFPCLLHHRNASATNLTILSSSGLFSLSSIHLPRKHVGFFHCTS